MMITIIDYNMGNSAAILNMFKRIGFPAHISKDPKEIMKAEKLILPGVGAFDSGIKNLDSIGINEILVNRVQNDQIPILGICLGMQLMTESSEEGTLPGLSWIKAKTVRFQSSNSDIKIPHMGWNEVEITKPTHLFAGYATAPRFYFVHSYYVVCQNQQDSIASSRHGVEFTCAFQKRNIFGVQFHPEKSHTFGLQLLKNFAEYQHVKT